MSNPSNESVPRLTLTQRQVMATGLASKHRGELIVVERRIMDITGKASDVDDKWRKDKGNVQRSERFIDKTLEDAEFDVLAQ